MTSPAEVRAWPGAVALKRVGLLYHPSLAAASELAQELLRSFQALGLKSWAYPALANAQAQAALPTTDLVVSVGGDGTILQTARVVLPYSTPILAVNYGRLGFLAELAPTEVQEALPRLLAGGGWLEERSMLAGWLEPPAEGWTNPSHALNDIVVNRGPVGRPIEIAVWVDGEPFLTYLGDAVILATATGSTAYSLSAGGPILPPEGQEMVLTPVAAHLSLANSIVLPASAEVELRVHSDHRAAYSVDGQGDTILTDGHRVRVRQSPYRTRFLRLRPRTSFYSAVRQQLSYRPQPPGSGAEEGGL